MVSTASMMAIVLACASAGVALAEGPDEWCWDNEDCGPRSWGKLTDADGNLLFPDCNLMAQSPIDVSGSAPTVDTLPAGEYLTHAPEPVAFAVKQSHGAPVFSCPEDTDCGSLTYGNQTFDLLQFHFHAPSENTIDGKLYPLEMHMVHQAEDGQYGVFGIMFELGEETPEPILSAWQQVAATEGLTDAIDIGQVYDNLGSIAAWDGSFTTPPCSEGVQWVLSRTPSKITRENFEAFWDYIGGYPGNWRNTQPLNGRLITY